jgi:ketosteroid isomerase-like protein
MATLIVQDQIRLTNRRFETALANGDAAAVAALYTLDGQVLAPNYPAVVGRQAIERFWQAVIQMGVHHVTLSTLELELGFQNIACEQGKAILRSETGAVVDAAKYIVIWKPEAGWWKWHRSIWNSDSAAQPCDPAHLLYTP